VTRAALSDRPLSVDNVLAEVRHAGAGGLAVFIGTVRDHNDGRAVTRLEYEAYAAMAVAEMERIVAEIEAAIPGARAALAHRIGALEVGEMAVVCAASAPHGPDGPYWVGWEDARCAHPEGAHEKDRREPH